MRKTRLYNCHIQSNAKMVEFFKWKMPVEYSGIVEEHNAVRTRVGLFDVSHMGEILISGTQALDLVQYLTPNDASRLNPQKAQYSALTTPEGTFVDDMLVYMRDDTKYLLVVNAANTDKDFEWIQKHQSRFDAEVKNVSDEYTQLALQGPRSVDVLTPLTDLDLEEMKPFRVRQGKVAGEEAMVSRTGYTGEDGFEVYTLSLNPEKIWDSLLEEGQRFQIKPVGLGARDTLRLEACLMLYGNDIDDTTTVLEAGLGWLIKFKKGEFLGRESLMRQKEEGIKKRIAGFEIKGRGIARHDYPVFIEGTEVSKVTSGTFSPYFKKSIGLTYLPVAHTEPGKKIEIGIRGKKVEAEVVTTPFYSRKKA
ncbi:MAG: glycine cleavage system aminomethyltransferase GcvT [Candidatus Aminicenantes bacterium]|nr:glycine cleavage system aminomethyltransferase GcvT [Candidatus Aminicenantes bacterium]